MHVPNTIFISSCKLWFFAMPVTQLIVLVLALVPAFSFVSARHWLSKPLIGADGRIYVCCDNIFFAFESNGSIAWSIHVDYKCNVGMAPVHGGPGKIYFVAENRILMINYGNAETSEPAAEVFFGPEPGQQAQNEIIGLSVSTLSSTVFINIKNRGLFAYLSHGLLLWSVGPVLYQFGYQQGCRKNLTDCYFASVPVLEQCEASIYVANTEGELYCLSVRSRHFRWLQDFSSLDKNFTITPGNNGRLYVTFPTRALILALDVFSGNVLWQSSIGPVSKIDCAPVVDSNGWISIGSLDGFMYSFSPTGVLKKFSRRNTENSIVQVGPFLDCSGFAVYSSQIEMEGKVSHTIGEYTIVSAIRPKAAIFTMLVPATGSIYWSEGYPGQLSTLLSKSDLSQFVANEEILLAFLAASKVDTPLQCRTIGQKLASSCSQARTKLVNIYSGNERTIILFLLFESALLVVLIGLVRFCCTFWAKRKLKDQGLGSFLDKRCSLQLQKKALDRTITELEKKAAEEAVDNEVIEKLGDVVRKKECIERKLSTTYSLGRDKTDSHTESMLPLHMGKTKSYSFQGRKQQKLTMFHTFSDTSSNESSSEGDTSMFDPMDSSAKAKAKTPMVEDTSTSSNERTIVLFLLFESALLVVLIGLVRFCCAFWAKRKLKDQGLGSFLDKRCSLQLQKKALERTITELEKKAAEEAVDNEVIEKLGDVVRKKECIERKLSTTYSLGRDKTDSHTESMLPLHMGKTRSYSFQGGKQQKLTMFHTLSDTSFSESSSEGETSMFEAMDPSAKVKAKTPMEEDTSSNFYSTNPLDVT